MVNPKDTAAKLARELGVALEQLHMPAARRRELEELAASAQDLAKRLDYIHQEYMLLDLRDDRSVFDDAYQQWAVLPGGRVDGTVLERIVTVSQPLGRLHRAGITIDSLKKFNEVETAFALRLGDDFASLDRAWDGLKKVISRPNPDLRFQRQHLPTVRKFLDALEALNIFQLTGFEYGRAFRSDNGGKSFEWLPLDLVSMPKHIGQKTLLRARMKPLSPAARPLVTGEWLNAYAAHLVHDHLRRNDMPHEIYTNVVYSAPREIISVSGDFDVIVQAGDKIAVFECKSGALDGTRDGLGSVIEKAAGLRQVIDKTGAEVSLTSLLLFNPSAADRRAVEDALSGTGVRAVTPDQVRRVTMELFGTP